MAAAPGAERHVLRLEISADALAAFRDARRQLELQFGHSLDDDQACACSRITRSAVPAIRAALLIRSR